MAMKPPCIPTLFAVRMNKLASIVCGYLCLCIVSSYSGKNDDHRLLIGASVHVERANGQSLYATF